MTTLRYINPPGDPGDLPFSDVVQAGDTFYVSGCVPMDADGELVGGDDPERQAYAALTNLRDSLALAGLDFSHVVKLNMYLTDIQDIPAVRAPRQELFNGARPATTLVEVSALMLPGMRIEIDAIAVKSDANEPNQ